MAISRNNSLLSMKMAGTEGLADALRALGSDKDVRKVMRISLLEESRPVVKEARRLAAHATGTMRDKIDVSTTLSRRQRRGRTGRVGKDPNEAEVYIGAGARGPAVLIEFGTAPRYHRKSRRFVGATPARPFMRPAWEKFKGQILKRLAFRIWYEIEQAAERIRKRQERRMRREAREAMRRR